MSSSSAYVPPHRRRKSSSSRSNHPPPTTTSWRTSSSVRTTKRTNHGRDDDNDENVVVGADDAAATANVNPERNGETTSSSSIHHPTRFQKHQHQNQWNNNPNKNRAEQQHDHWHSHHSHHHYQRHHQQDDHHPTTTTTTVQETEAPPVSLQSFFSHIRCINLQRRPDRWRAFWARMETTLGPNGVAAVQRFDAVDGNHVMATEEEKEIDKTTETQQQQHSEPPSFNNLINLTWDATKNALYDRHIAPPFDGKQMAPGEVGCALSHIQLWQEFLVNNHNEVDHDTTNDSSDHRQQRQKPTTAMLILEDDAVFYNGGGRKGRNNNHTNNHFHNKSNADKTPPLFFQALSKTWEILPQNWDILYLGFSDRGERNYVQPSAQSSSSTIQINLFSPEYGFHTHAYALTPRAARVLLDHLPAAGPLDVWLADHDWFGLHVYCSVVAHQGWQGRGANLISQYNRKQNRSDIDPSGRGAVNEEESTK